MIETATRVVFPWFSIATCDTSNPWLSLSRMLEVLERGGFKTHAVFDIDGQVFEPVLADPPVQTLRFELELPEGWVLTEGYDGYGHKDSDTRCLLDEMSRLRGEVYYSQHDGELFRGELYTRYFKLNLPGFCKLPIELPAGCITDIIVDRAEVHYRKPAEYPVVALKHSRMAATTLPSSEAMVHSIREYGDEELARIKEGRPKLDPPIYRMLHENYPDWQDPYAYW